MSTFSSVVNGQLVPVAPAPAIVAPPAPNPIISGGAYATNLPGYGMMGGATNGPIGAPATGAISGSSTSTPATANASIGSALGNVWSLPFWDNPLALTLILLVLAYLILRFIHWRA